MSDHLTLWNQLKKESLINGDLPDETDNKVHWPIRIMQGFAGWIAALFLLGFIASIFDWPFNEKGFTFLILGLLGNIFAYFIFKQSIKNDFIRQIGFVINLCAQLLVAWGIWQLNKNNEASSYFILSLYQTLLVFVIPQYLSRFLSTWFAMLLLFAGFAELGVYNISITLTSALFVSVWLKDTQWGTWCSLWSPIAYGLAFSLLQFNGFLLFGEDIQALFQGNSAQWINELSYWLRKIIIAGIFIYLTQFVRQQLHINLKSKLSNIIIVSSIGLILLDYFIPGLSGALFLLLIGLIKQRRLLVSLGIAALLSFMSWYYYSLSMTLLSKSIILISFGICFAFAYFVLNRSSLAKRTSQIEHTNNTPLSKWISIGTLFLILALINFNIFQKENILKNGQIVLLKLAPVDPRSLMQGDYMRLRFNIENTLLKTTENESLLSLSQYAVVEIDKNKVATFSHLSDLKALTDHQVNIQFRLRNNKIRLATHAFFFEEGTADLYTPAIYGEFRVANNGELLLNNLRDKDFKILGYNRP